MRSLSNGTCYEDDPITRDDVVEIGDDLVCIIPYNPEDYSKIHESVVTVCDISDHGGIAIRQHTTGTHFIRKCFHRIIEREDVLRGFDDVFA